jgi:hypothetical protein
MVDFQETSFSMRFLCSRRGFNKTPDLYLFRLLECYYIFWTLSFGRCIVISNMLFVVCKWRY